MRSSFVGNIELTDNEPVIISEGLPDKSRVIIMIPSPSSTFGALVCIDSLWSLINIHDHISGKEFKYLAGLSVNDKTYDENGELVFRDNLSTYFPDYILTISLEDPGILGSYVIRRNLAFVIALILLLVAMVLGVIMILRDILREKKMVELRSDFVFNAVILPDTFESSKEKVNPCRFGKSGICRRVAFRFSRSASFITRALRINRSPVSYAG